MKAARCSKIMFCSKWTNTNLLSVYCENNRTNQNCIYFFILTISRHLPFFFFLNGSDRIVKARQTFRMLQRVWASLQMMLLHEGETWKTTFASPQSETPKAVMKPYNSSAQ